MSFPVGNRDCSQVRNRKAVSAWLSVLMCTVSCALPARIAWTSRRFNSTNVHMINSVRLLILWLCKTRSSMSFEWKQGSDPLSQCHARSTRSQFARHLLAQTCMLHWFVWRKAYILIVAPDQEYLACSLTLSIWELSPNLWQVLGCNHEKIVLTDRHTCQFGFGLYCVSFCRDQNFCLIRQHTHLAVCIVNV